MRHNLQAPGTDEAPNWSSLYRARGAEEVAVQRPLLTGDIFVDIPVLDGEGRYDLAILQHPCAIRRGTLNEKILCAEVSVTQILKPSKWATQSYREMPLPELRPDSATPNYAVKFEKFHIVSSQNLLAGERIACLDLVGIDLFLQRWVHHNSRVVVPTSDYLAVTVGQYAEADIIEDWCLERHGRTVEEAEAEADAWLGDLDAPGVSRRRRLEDEEYRARIRRDARGEARRLNSL